MNDGFTMIKPEPDDWCCANCTTLYRVKPGDVFALGYGNFTKKPKIGQQYENYPAHVIDIGYYKMYEFHHKRWWQFWIRKNRLVYLVEWEGNGREQ